MQSTITAHSPRKQHAQALFAGLPRRYELMGTLMSFGQDPRWRRALVDAVAPAAGDRVLDVATGTGLVAGELVRRRGARVVGLDQSEPMLEEARRRLDRDRAVAARVELVHGEAEALPFADSEFDGLTFTYLLRYVDDPAATLGGLARVVKPGGRIGALEFGVPPRRGLRECWRAYTRLGLPLIGRAASPDWQEVGRFLGPSIEEFYARYPLAEQKAMWRAAGIGGVQVRRMSFGAGVLMWGVRDGVGSSRA